MDRDRSLGRWAIRQGIEMGRPSELTIELLGERDELRSVRVGGAAVRMGRGMLRVPDDVR